MGRAFQRGAWAWTLGVALLSGVSCKKATQPFPESYVGVGVELTMQGEQPRVVKVLEGGPASAAGLKPGAVLTEVDGQPTGGSSLPEIVGMLRGPPGSSVRVTAREGPQEYRVMLVRRALRRDSASNEYAAPPR